MRANKSHSELIDHKLGSIFSGDDSDRVTDAFSAFHVDSPEF